MSVIAQVGPAVSSHTLWILTYTPVHTQTPIFQSQEEIKGSQKGAAYACVNALFLTTSVPHGHHGDQDQVTQSGRKA